MTTLQSSTETPLQPGVWTVDAAHSLVEFSVRHMTVAQVTGRFGAVNGTVEVPAGDPLGATVRADIDVASVSAGHPKRDELIRSTDFLDAETHPVITFTGGSAKPTADGRWNVPGDLTIKGVTRPVVLDTVFGGAISHRGAIRAGFSAVTEINRKDFGVTWNAALDSGGAIVSDLVRITLEIELVLTQS